MRNAIFTAVLSLCLTGCLEFDVLVKVKPDGSGTVEQTVLVNKSVLNNIKEAAASIGAGQDSSAEEINLIDREKLLQEAKSMGKGVRFIDAKPFSANDLDGYIAYFEFTDINTVTLNQNPSGKTPMAKEADQTAAEEPVTFSLRRGQPSILTIHLPEKSFAPDSAETGSEESQPESNDTTGLSMMMSLMKGFRMSIAVQIEGKILEAEATHVDGNRVTLLEVDFEQLARDSNRFAELTKQQPQTVEEAKQLLKNIPGIKFEFLRNPSVRFQEL
jgi:hypothetical protein